MKDILIRVKRVSHVNRVSPVPKTGNKRLKFFSLFAVSKYFWYRVSSKNKPAIFPAAVVVTFFLFFAINFAAASEITPQKVVEFANQDREEKGLELLNENEKLARAATAKADDMVSKDYFSHTSPEGVTPWRWFEAANYDYNYAGENLAMDFKSSEKMNSAWLASPTHRANILNEKYKDIGVAVKEGAINGHSTILVVQLFGSGDKSAPEQAEEKQISEKKKSDSNKGDMIPNLPITEGENVTSVYPTITFPQKEERISKKEIEIIGRAKPGSNVNIFDKGKLIANAAVNNEGWFKTGAQKFLEGEHVLKIESVQSSFGNRAKELISGSEISFSVDTVPPEVKYQLLAGKTENEIIVNLSAGKPNCIFQVGGEKIFVDSTKSAHIMVKKEKLSVPLTAEDEAGNKTFLEINLFNFFQREDNFDIVRELASSLSPQELFAADSGQEAIQKNIGLAPHQIQLSQAFK